MPLEIGAESPEGYEVLKASFHAGALVRGRHRCAEFEVEAEVETEVKQAETKRLRGCLFHLQAQIYIHLNCLTP